MKRESVFLMILPIILVTVLSTTLGAQRVEASETIYIRADGSIDPPTAPISTVDNVTYVMTGNITSDADGIIVKRDNIVVYGASYTLMGSGSGTGIDLSERSNVTIQNTNIGKFWFGIWFNYSSNNSISGSNITSSVNGIELSSSSNNSIDKNTIANNYVGIYIRSSINTISENNITNNTNTGIWLDISSANNINRNNIMNNGNGILLYDSSNNTVCHNNFINNGVQDMTPEHANVWDDGYPSGGNYWSDYSGTDADHDGIGDSAYVIDASNADHYPLMTQYVIPEFPSFLILPIFFVATLLAVMVWKRKHAQRE